MARALASRTVSAADPDASPPALAHTSPADLVLRWLKYCAASENGRPSASRPATPGSKSCGATPVLKKPRSTSAISPFASAMRSTTSGPATCAPTCCVPIPSGSISGTAAAENTGPWWHSMQCARPMNSAKPRRASAGRSIGTPRPSRALVSNGAWSETRVAW
jgi:hypothetical protein